jgi:polygalacturonase
MKITHRAHVVRTLLVIFMASGIVSVNAAETVIEKTCEAIQKAIYQLPSDGGELTLLPGTYTCIHPIIIDKHNVTLRGAGPATLLRLADNANAPVIIMGLAENIPNRSTRHVRQSILRVYGGTLQR